MIKNLPETAPLGLRIWGALDAHDLRDLYRRQFVYRLHCVDFTAAVAEPNKHKRLIRFLELLCVFWGRISPVFKA